MSEQGRQAYTSAIELFNAGALDEAQVIALTLLEASNNNRFDKAAAQRLIGIVASQRSQYEFAQRNLMEALEIVHAQDEYVLVAMLNADIGRNLRAQTLYANALRYFHKALSLYESFELQTGIAEQHNNIGATLEKLGQYEQALQSFSLALEVQRQQNDTFGLSTTLFNIAEVHRELTQLDIALGYFKDSLEIAIQLGDKRLIAQTNAKIGAVLNEQGQFEQAKSAFDVAISLFTELENRQAIAGATAGLGEALIGMGKQQDGMQLLRDVLMTSQKNNFPAILTQVRLSIAQVNIQQANYAQALEQIQLGLTEATARNELPRQAEFESLRVSIFEKTKQYDQAFNALRNQQALEASILQARREAALLNLQSEVEYVRQEQSIALLRKNKAIELNLAEQRNMRNITLMASLIILLLLAFLLFSRHSQKLRNQQLTGIVKRRTHELEKKNEELQQAYRTLEHMSLRDSLTGCYNRHFLDANLPAEINRCLFSYTSASELGKDAPHHNDLLCFLIDIDDFKHVNDTYGHVTGDRFLIQFAKIINLVFRHSDLQIRWGGEEFLVICRNTPRRDAAMLAERLRSAVAEASFSTQSGSKIKATCSIGFCAFPLDIDEPGRIGWDASFDLTDHCLYSAKLSGKNCWVGINHAKATVSAEELSDNEKTLGLGRLEVVTSLNHLSSIKWHSSDGIKSGD
ncbi:GGDEF domain-containing protein [Alteromonas facilis]|uniref:GGDEF domain-containing protein n=1 Tax=Alteromonas facilis TaxID=2048004 RepID=UPI000C290701|nr:GGDEF domain-containing protein [Alteromonas facilis]